MRRVAIMIEDRLEFFDTAAPSMLSRPLTDGGAFSESSASAAFPAAAVERVPRGAGEGDSSKVMRAIADASREGLPRVTGVSSAGASVVFSPAAPAAALAAFFADPSIIVAIVARSDASSVDALSNPSDERRLMSAFFASTLA